MYEVADSTSVNVDMWEKRSDLAHTSATMQSALKTASRSPRSAALVGGAQRSVTYTVTAPCCSGRSAADAASTSASTGYAFRQVQLRPAFQQRYVIAAAAAAESASSPFILISKTEVPSFIQRDDMIDQLLRWATYEAGDSGVRNFGMPMKVKPTYDADGTLWGFTVSIFKEGNKLTDIAISFDGLMSQKFEWVGRGDDGFPILEGKVQDVKGKYFEIWKLDRTPVDEDLRGTIRAFCTGLVAALNRYYAFGSVFVDDAT